MSTNEICKYQIKDMFKPYMITKKEQKELVDRYFNGEYGLRDRIIASYIPLVIGVINKKFMYVDERYADDCFSLGCIGLVKAFDTFKNDKGASFSTYAYTCIWNSIAHFFRKIKRTPITVSLDAPLASEDCSEELCVKDIIEDDHEESQPENVLFDSCFISEVESKLNLLKEVEREVIKIRYFNEKCYNQEETARILEMSQAGVSRAEKRGITKIKEALFS